jgi:aminoglycoside phosphotransferase (APT) family kinase protein
MQERYDTQHMDQPVDVRPGEALDVIALSAYLAEALPGFQRTAAVRQFPGGYSNLTYLVQTNLGDYVLRRPPFGATGKGAHDMGREYGVLRRLEGVFPSAPRPVCHCADTSVLGAPFYLMERVEGVILRQRLPEGWPDDPALMQAISEAAIDQLAALHRIDIEAAGLLELGKPEGYVARQVSGWTERYLRAQTDDIPDIQKLAEWLAAHLPRSQPAALLHNDYKYDNLVLDPLQPARIRAVLDWEMATVGDPLMDLGLALAYWGEAAEARAQPLLAANLTWLPGNLNRAQVAERYAAATGADLSDLLFYYAFGNFKIAVVVQQIYARWKQGLTQDPRFGALIEAVRYFGSQGMEALRQQRISNLR